MKSIQVFIATYNRPDLVIRAIQSVLNQTYQAFEFIISDNSTNEDTFKLIKSLNSPKIKYKRRIPSLPPLSHLNAILDDVKADYFMIFHDDDVMCPEMIEELLKEINNHENIIAIGANAYLNINNQTTKRLFYNYSKKNLILKKVDEVAYQYLVGGNMPFPSYLYKNEVSDLLRFDPLKGGKYCDVSFIMDVASIGYVEFLSKPLMISYIHKGQDSAKNNFMDKMRLVYYFVKKTRYDRKNFLVKKYRIQNLYCELKSKLISREISVFSKRYLKLIKIFLISLRFNELIKTFIISIFLVFKLPINRLERVN